MPTNSLVSGCSDVDCGQYAQLHERLRDENWTARCYRLRDVPFGTRMPERTGQSVSFDNINQEVPTWADGDRTSRLAVDISGTLASRVPGSRGGWILTRECVAPTMKTGTVSGNAGGRCGEHGEDAGCRSQLGEVSSSQGAAGGKKPAVQVGKSFTWTEYRLATWNN